MLYLKRGAAAQVIAAKNSILEGERKFFLALGGAEMPFFSGFAQTLVPRRHVQQRILTSAEVCTGFDSCF
jgi:hypothetical protein